jgi:hypothetical protein
MSHSLHFNNFNEYLQKHLTNLFVVYSATSKGILENSCSKYKDIKQICDYIKTRFYDKPSDLIRREIKIMSDKSDYVYLLQISVYPEFSSFKHYYIFNQSESELESLLEFMINTDFK